MLRDVEMFDASFFGYSPKDATLMDPQQRLFLEVCWEAFENAGYDPVAYPGKVGVLSAGGGVVTSYLLAKLHHAELPGQTASIAHINDDKDFLSTRVSFKLNLTGPSFTIQSACSSSLVAIHQACQNLRFNECDMMLVGGSVVRVPQVQGYLAEKEEPALSGRALSAVRRGRPRNYLRERRRSGAAQAARRRSRGSRPYLCSHQRDCGQQRWLKQKQLHRPKVSANSPRRWSTRWNWRE